MPLLAALLSGCADLGRPGAASPDTVLVGGGESASVAVISVERQAATARIGPVPSHKDAYALSRQGDRLYITAWAYPPTSGAELLAVDTRSLSVVLRESLSAIGANDSVGAVLLKGVSALCVSGDGTHLVLDADRGGVTGLALVDIQHLQTVGFLAPLSVAPGGVVRMPTAVARDVYLVIGTHSLDLRPHTDYLFVVGNKPFAVLDSFQLTSPISSGDLSLFQVVPTSDGATAFLVTTDSILRLELGMRTVTASMARPSQGWLSLSPDGNRLYLTDPGDFFDTPGSGLVRVYDSALAELAPIDLRGFGSVTSNRVTVTKDLRYVLISSGTASRGPLFGPQPGRVFVVDRTTHRILGAILTGDWNASEIFVF